MHDQFHCMEFGKKIREMKRALIFVVKSMKKTCQNERLQATGYQWVLVLAQHVTNTHLYPVALRFDEFFHGIFKTPQITNVNLIVAVLLVESNTMHFDDFFTLIFLSIFASLNKVENS